MPTLQIAPPRFDKLEMSVFGPGFGESVAANVGCGEWIIVGSCIDKLSGIPKPLEYLKSIGIDPANSVKIVVASHWHDDHIAGISKTLDVCRSASFCCPSALSKKDFLNLAELYRHAPGDFPPGTEEIRKAVEIAALRSKEFQRAMLRYAKSDNLVWKSSDSFAWLFSLSPSDEMNRRALEFMAQAYATAKSGNAVYDRLTPSTPNDTAVALRLDVGGRSVLLGSDLESGSNPLLGWSDVLESYLGTEKKSSVFKVAHHGSKSGHHDGIWSAMLKPHPWALISPFRWGRHRIPDANERARILAVTANAFITSHPDKDASPRAKRSPKIEAFIQQATKKRRIAAGPIGHIRWRASLSDSTDEGRAELFDGALHLSKVA